METTISSDKLQQIIEAALMVAGRPLSIPHIQRLFEENEQPTSAEIRTALDALKEHYQNSGIHLNEVASGFQFQANTELSPWLAKLWDERPPRYSRALLETLALIAYRQPITRAEIEEIRGVTVSSHIIKTLLEREWIRVIGYREVVGRPALYGSTKIFLDHFNLKSLDELPTLAELKDLETQAAKLQVQLELTDSAPQTETDLVDSSQSDQNATLTEAQEVSDLVWEGNTAQELPEELSQPLLSEENEESAKETQPDTSSEESIK